MSKLPISVCMVSGAEARRIGKALESVAGWVSEIIVVLDDRAQDGTEAIVEQAGGKVFRESWKGFIGQKNSAAARGGQPWLLNLDADEVVSQPLREEIHALFDGPGLDACAAYRFPRCTSFYGRWIRHGDWYPDRVLRLWKRDSARWVGEEPHACLDVQGRVGTLHGDLLHYSMESYEQQIAKTIQYADDFVRDCAAKHRKISMADLYLRPTWRFVRAYFLKFGFLDGWQGYSIAWMTAFYTFLRYAKSRAVQTGRIAPH